MKTLNARGGRDKVNSLCTFLADKENMFFKMRGRKGKRRDGRKTKP